MSYEQLTLSYFVEFDESDFKHQTTIETWEKVGQRENGVEGLRWKSEGNDE